MLARFRCSRVPLPHHSAVRAYGTKPPKDRIIDIAENGTNWLFSWAIYDTLSKSKAGLGLDVLLRGLRFYRAPYVWKAMSQARPRDVWKSEGSLCVLLSKAISNDNLEMAMQYLYALRLQNMEVPLEVVELLVSLAASRNEARLAIDIALWFEETHSQAGLCKKTWLDCLVSALFCRYDEGVATCWRRLKDGGDLSVTGRTRQEVQKVLARLAIPQDP